MSKPFGAADVGDNAADGVNECNSSLQLFFTAPKLKHEGSAEAQIRRHLYAEMELWTKQQATHGLLMEQLM